MTQEIFFIGTLHAGFTNILELKDLVNNLNPDQLFVEIEQKDLENETIDSYPSEMIALYNWAKQENILVCGFDSNIDVIKKGKTSKDNADVILKQEEIIKNYDWKEFNKQELNEKLDFISKNLINYTNWNIREKEMAGNIRQQIIKKGKIIVLTGSAHLSYFKKEFSKAKFPLRVLNT